MTGTADVVVIGAGHNSLIAAAYLAAAGLQVAVLEERDLLGGNTVTEELTLPGFHHDSCSSAHVLLQSNPLLARDELGLLAGGLRYIHTDPAVVLTWEGGATVMSRSVERTAAELARFHPADGPAYTGLLEEWEGGLARAHARWNAGRLDPQVFPEDRRYGELRAGTAVSVLESRFTHPRSRDLIAWLSFATISRIDRPGTGILPFAITAGRARFGWATPVGGSGALPQALAAHIEARGGTVRTGVPVERVLVEDGRACGVRTVAGEVWTARRAVLSSAHLTQLPGMLEGASSPELTAAAARWQPGLSLFAVHLAVDGAPRFRTAGEPIAAAAGGLGTLAGLLAQLAAFDAGQADDRDPWLLVVCPGAVDSSRAPRGQATVKLLTVAPRGVDEASFGAALVARAATRMSGLDPARVLAVRPEGPVSLERRNRHNVGGSCHGGEFADGQGGTLVGWPDYRLPVPGLYQTGSTTHPGGSVSGRPGRGAARVLLEDLGIDPAGVMGGA